MRERNRKSMAGAISHYSRWTEDEFNFVLNNRKTMSIPQVSEVLHRTHDGVKMFCYRNHISFDSENKHTGKRPPVS